MVPLDLTEFDRWRAAAARAVGAAETQSAAGYHEWSCFLYEQSAQFAIKGLLNGVGAGAWGHDLASLVAAEPEAVGAPWLGGVERSAERLGRFYLPTRYPDALPGGVPGQRFSDEDASGAADDAADDAAAVLASVDQAWAALLAEAEDGGR